MAGVEKVGVLGAGTMGAGIAQVFAQAGKKVCVVDSFPGALDKAWWYVETTADNFVELFS